MSHPSSRRTRSFWGWGVEEEAASPAEVAAVESRIESWSDGHGVQPVAVPEVDDFQLPAPRVQPPDSLRSLFEDAPRERLRHTYGSSFASIARMLLRDAPHPPDWVAFPSSAEDIEDLFDWSSRERVAVVPFGGGSSVCGGVDSELGDGHRDRFRAVVSLDLARLDRVLEIDTTSRAAHLEAGLLGPNLEASLRPHGLTLRHFPQSFEFSTLGGWIATRAGGHYATLHTHIDDFVESIRMVTPQGRWHSRRLPGSGAGPSPDRMMIGSEGIFGVITDAWVRLQDRPTFRASASVAFASMHQATSCVRALTQSGLHPTNCRLLDPAEAASNGIGDGRVAVLVLGFESADHPLDAWMARALELVGDHGGAYDAGAVQRSLLGKREEHREGAAGTWRNAFLRAPYLRDVMVRYGVIVDTFETSITWDRFADFYDVVRNETREAIRRITGQKVDVSCRLTHAYPDGAAPYFTYSVLGSPAGDLASSLDQWREIKSATNEITVRHGGTVTHHHAVGRDHRSGFDEQTCDLHRDALRAVKRTFDPEGLLNPGVLIDP